jgi:hypothetical protein
MFLRQRGLSRNANVNMKGEIEINLFNSRTSSQSLVEAMGEVVKDRFQLPSVRQMVGIKSQPTAFSN